MGRSMDGNPLMTTSKRDLLGIHVEYSRKFLNSLYIFEKHSMQFKKYSSISRYISPNTHFDFKR